MNGWMRSDWSRIRQVPCHMPSTRNVPAVAPLPGGSGSDHPEMLALYLGMLDADFSVDGSPELVDALRKLASRYQRAIDSSQQAPG